MSINLNPKFWALSAGGIPYKLMNGFPTGSLNEESGQIDEKYIIQAKDLAGFLGLSFPRGINLDEETFIVSPNRRYPGSTAFHTTSVAFAPLRDALPADPYNLDPGAPSGTYDDFIVVSVSYITGPQNEDENDPTTFLQISADSTAEFLTVPVRGLNAAWSDSHASWKAEDQVKSPLTNVTKIVPETQWDVTWPRINRAFMPTIIEAMRNRMGLVNEKKMPLLQNAVAETVMFIGYSYQEDYTWREGWENTPVTVGMKFLEKHVKQDGKVIGHNHFIKDETGQWEPLQINEKPVYESSDLNNLFPPQVKATD